MSDLRGWNRCDDCGRFANPDELVFEEARSLKFGVLYEEYVQYHKEGKCPATKVSKPLGVSGE